MWCVVEYQVDLIFVLRTHKYHTHAHTPCLMMGEVSLETSPKTIMIQDMINSENSMINFVHDYLLDLWIGLTISSDSIYTNKQKSNKQSNAILPPPRPHPGQKTDCLVSCKFLILFLNHIVNAVICSFSWPNMFGSVADGTLPGRKYNCNPLKSVFQSFIEKFCLESKISWMKAECVNFFISNMFTSDNHWPRAPYFGLLSYKNVQLNPWFLMIIHRINGSIKCISEGPPPGNLGRG